MTYTILRRSGQAARQQNQNQKTRIASAERRVKPPARLLRCATALRVTAPLGYGSRRLVWPKGSFRRVRTARPPLSLPSRILGPVLTVKGTASPRLERTLGRSEGWLFKRERGELRPGGSSLHKRAISQRPATRTWARTRPVRLKKSSALPTPAHPPARSTLGEDG